MIKHSQGSMESGFHVSHLRLLDLLIGLIRQPCFNHRLGLLDAYVERSQTSIFMQIYQIEGGCLILWWPLSFECFAGRWLSTQWSRKFFSQSAPDFRPDLTPTTGFAHLYSRLEPTSELQMPVMPFQCDAKIFCPCKCAQPFLVTGITSLTGVFALFQAEGHLLDIILTCYQICQSDLLPSQIFCNPTLVRFRIS